jgi:hypothetical protein
VISTAPSSPIAVTNPFVALQSFVKYNVVCVLGSTVNASNVGMMATMCALRHLHRSCADVRCTLLHKPPTELQHL